MADVRLAKPRGEPVAFEKVYLRFAPFLRKIAVGKFGIPAADAEPLVHDVFATYLTRAEEVEHLERYLIGGICNASRHYLRRGAAADDLFCGEEPCAATPTEAILLEVERKILIGRMLVRVGSPCRDILYRYYVNGETTGAIADDHGFKPATILIFLSKCRRSALSAYHAMTGAVVSGRHLAEVDLAVYALAPELQGAEQRADIAAHLAECAACQQTCDFFAVSEEVLEAEFRDPMTWEPVAGSETQRALAEYGELVAEEDHDAAELLKDYLEKPIHAAWQLLMMKRRLRTGGVVRALIRAAHNVHEDNALTALTFADSAIAIVEGLEEERYPRSAADQLRATAWKERANAQLYLGRFADALRSLDTAERFHRRYSPNGLGLSIMALVRGSVLYAQEHFTEAMVLAERAEIGFAHAGDDKRRMDAVFLRASILFEVGRPADAVSLFRQTIEYGEETQNLRLVARGCYAIGNCEVDLNRLGEASIHFHRALAILREVGPESNRIATEWGIARVVLRAGNYDDAIHRLRSASAAFEQREMATFATLVSLDIVDALLALKEPRRIFALAQHLFSVFAKQGRQGLDRVIEHYLRDCFRKATRATVGELATILGCHPDYLTRMAGAILGASLLDYLRGKQLEEAERLITVTSLRMKEIALRAGFGTVSTFYRHFREAHGMSPAAFRKVRK